MRLLYNIGLLLVATMLWISCVDNRRFPIERFDRASRDYNELNLVAQDSVRSQYAIVIDFFQSLEGIDDADSMMRVLSQSHAVAVFQPDIEMYLPDLSNVESDLFKLKENISTKIPEIKFPNHIYGAVIPYDQSIIVIDSVMMLGLNHYLGVDYAGYNGFENYRRQLKEPNRIVCDVAEALIYTTFPYQSSPESTAFSRIAYDGLVLYVLKSLVPDAELSYLLGYNQQQIQWALDNESRVWKKMIEDNMLYSSDPSIALRLVEPSRFTSIINPMCPGRIGRYIGYKIVSSYFSSNTEVTLTDVFEKTLYMSPDMLIQASYKGM